jgi:diphthine synthase
MLTFIGLGLWDQSDISLRGLSIIASADAVFLEEYTSRLMGTTVAEMERFYKRPVRLLTRESVEVNPGEVLGAASVGSVVFLTAGDPMVSTTHTDLRMRAHALGIKTEIVHGASIASAVCGLSGLQNCRFGRSCSLPFPVKNWAPETPFEVVRENLAAGLHTLVFLDIQEGRYMTVNEGVSFFTAVASRRRTAIGLFVGIARAGSPSPVVLAGNAEKVSAADFGGPLHILIVPGPLHVMEQEYLCAFAGL